MATQDPNSTTAAATVSQTETPADPATFHQAGSDRESTEASRLERTANRISLVRLLLFVLAAALIAAGIQQDDSAFVGLGLGAVGLFAMLVIAHLRLLSLRDAAARRQAIHQRHLSRLNHDWIRFPIDGSPWLPEDHDYAGDLDVVGPGSLFARIDTTHTVGGARLLARWLGYPAEPAILRERQTAVAELAANPAFRVELEAAMRVARGDEKLDPSPFLEFAKRKSYLAGHPAKVALITILPLLTLSLYAAGALGTFTGMPPRIFLVGVLLQALVVLLTGRETKAALDLVAARRGYLEAFQTALLTLECHEFEAPCLAALQKQIRVQGHLPSKYLKQLDRWAGLSDLRTQFPLNLLANFGLLWDLRVLPQLERWNERVGAHLSRVFSALAEVEALSALATLAYIEPSSTFPSLEAPGSALVATGLGHPLLPHDDRVHNDVRLPGPGSALIVTGSNMAGKSTLLRALGLNMALAFAGGPVIATRFALPSLRLRASMRARDSLQRGASYFHAELKKLKTVVQDAELEPPVFFLLDELLRGTNARARHIGARAVVIHLLDRNAYGVVATHDIALSKMERERPEHIANVHFTDVMNDGDMLFDYRLREGVVKTSNALRLLKMAGITVEVDDSLTDVPG